MLEKGFRQRGNKEHMKARTPHADGELAPNLEYLMASVIRLMALCTEKPCPAQQRTLVHLLNYLLKQPRLARTPGAADAVGQAAAIWRSRAAASACDDGTRH